MKHKTAEEKPIRYMQRAKLADAIHKILDSGIEMLDKHELDKNDFAKIKVIRTVSSALSSAVLMVQQETAQERNQIVIERMKQLGYNTPQLEG